MATIGNLAIKLSLSTGTIAKDLSLVQAKLSQVGKITTKPMDAYALSLKRSQDKILQRQTMLADRKGGMPWTLEKAASAVYLVKNAFDALWSILTLPIAIGQSAIEAAAKWETLEVTLGVLTGSAEKARSILSQLQGFAKGSPVSITELAASTQRLTAYGFEAEQALAITERLAVLTSAFPGDASEAMGRMTIALGQMHGKSRVMTQEMNQLTEAGIAEAWQALARALGTDVGGAMKKVGEGAVSAQIGLQAIMGLAEDPKFIAAWEARKNTLEGMWASVKSSWQGALRDLGFILIEGLDLKGGAKSLEEFISVGRTKLKEWKPFLLEFLESAKSTFVSVVAMLVDFGKTVADVFAKLASIEMPEWMKKTGLVSDATSDLSAMASPTRLLRGEGGFARFAQDLKGDQSLPEKLKESARSWDALLARFKTPLPKPDITAPVNAFGGAIGAFGKQLAVMTEGGALGGAVGMFGKAPQMIEEKNKKLATLQLGQDKAQRAMSALSEEFADPLTKFETKVKELQELRKKGLDENIFSLAISDAFQNMQKSLGDVQMKLPETAIEGSMEAARAIVQHQLRRSKPDDRGVKILEDLRENAKRHLEEAKKLTAQLANIGVAGFGLGIP